MLKIFQSREDSSVFFPGKQRHRVFYVYVYPRITVNSLRDPEGRGEQNRV